jgi:protein-S-isoprenylcysteine O-methyltransferase Ste14
MGTLLGGILLHLLFPWPILAPWPARIAGAILLVPGAVIGKWGENTMRQAGTNVHPGQPTTAIVTGGPFRFSRNPLYLALVIFYVALTLVVNTWWPLLLLIPLLAVVQWGIVAREERYLEAKFGEPYRAYKARVRRWL